MWFLILRPDIKNLNRVAYPQKPIPIEHRISKHWTQFQVEPTMFEPRLKFEKQHKFFKFGHDLIMNKI